MTQVPVMASAGILTGLDSENGSIKKIRQKEWEEENATNEMNIVEEMDVGIEPVTERISDGETNESKDIPVPTGLKLSTYKLDQLAHIEAIRNDPQMLAPKKDIKGITQGMKKLKAPKAAAKPCN